MTIYHGSDTPVKNPRILISNRLLDFGEGFYSTSSLEQAQRWAKRVRERNKTKEEVVSIYEFDADKAEKEIKIIKIDSPDSEWLHFISSCRSGKEAGLEYDDEAFLKLYNSTLYFFLENEQTKVWHYSAEKLFRLFDEELNTGKLGTPNIFCVKRKIS